MEVAVSCASLAERVRGRVGDYAISWDIDWVTVDWWWLSLPKNLNTAKPASQLVVSYFKFKFKLFVSFSLFFLLCSLFVNLTVNFFFFYSFVLPLLTSWFTNNYNWSVIDSRPVPDICARWQMPRILPLLVSHSHLHHGRPTLVHCSKEIEERHGKSLSESD